MTTLKNGLCKQLRSVYYPGQADSSISPPNYKAGNSQLTTDEGQVPMWNNSTNVGDEKHPTTRSSLAVTRWHESADRESIQNFETVRISEGLT